MSELPEKWSTATLADVCFKSQYGYTTKSTSKGDVRFLRTTDITSGVIDWFSVPFCLSNPENIDKYSLKDGDIVISRAGSVGFSCLLSNTPKNTVFASYLIRFRPTPPFSNHYLSYFLNSPSYWEQIVKHSVGVAVQNVNAKKLSVVKLPVAPLNEQIRIANKLNSLLGKLEATQKNLDKIPTLLKRFRQSVLAAAVSGELTAEWRKQNLMDSDSVKTLLEEINLCRLNKLQKEMHEGNNESKRIISKLSKHKFQEPSDNKLPKTWKWASLIEVMEKVVDCHNKTAPYTDKGIRLIRTTDIRNGIISLEKAKYINEDTYKFWSKRCPPEPGDLVLTREAPMGEIGIIPKNTTLCMGQRMMLLRPVHEYIINQYILYFMMSPETTKRMFAGSVGTGVKHLRVGDVESFAVKICPYKEQEEIVKRVESLFKLADKVEQQYQAAKQRTDKLTQSILAKAFRGELVPQDPNDEPASELLKRIQLNKA